MDKAKLWTNEGQPNNNQAFSLQKAALYSIRVLGFPFGEAVGFCRLKRSLQFFPLSEKKFSKLHFFGKNCQPLRAFPLLHTLPFQSIPALFLSSLLYPGFRRSGPSRPLQSPFFILPALFKNHFSSQSFRSTSLFSPEAQLLSHNFSKNAFYRATFFYFKCEHLFVFL